MRDLAVRVWWALRWYVGGAQSLGTAWKASAVYVEAMRDAGFRILT